MHRFNDMVRWPLGCLIFFIVGCESTAGYKTFTPTDADSISHSQMVSNAFKQISELEPSIKTGDLVTRTGNDFTSNSLRSLNQRDKTYSHCGIASVENGVVYIYHAMGGEWNPDQKILKEPFIDFAEPFSNKGIGHFRFPLSQPEALNIVNTIEQYRKDNVMFDMDFDLISDDRMYCAEFVVKSYSAGTNRLTFPQSHINKFAFYGVDDIFLHEKCKPISAISYK